ncbi:MAG: hypothetical protein QME52_10845 [Bacteroidota bacterium]|nr:hypothetical protein [Bacteroidota bacterium]
MPNNTKNDFKLKQYDILMQQNRFEHTSFWTRFGFMMVSQIGLLGFFLNMILVVVHKDYNLRYLLLTLPLSVVGLISVLFFFKLHSITKWWVDRWLKLIVGLESEAFGELNVVRGGRQEAPGSVRNVAKWFLILFTVIWSVSIVIVLILASCLK